MANRWGNNGNSDKHFSWAPKSLRTVTAAMKLKDAYSLEERTNLDSILKSRDITLPTKVHLVKAMSFPVVMYGCESWTIKKAEHWRNDTWTVVLEKTPESPLDCKKIKPVHPKGNQSWIFIGRTDAEAETLATWWKELTHLKRPWCWEILKAGEGGDRGWDGWMASLTQWAGVEQLQEMVKDRESWHAAVHGVSKNWTWLSEQQQSEF